MRILLVSAHGADPGYGGAERYVRDLATGMGARGHEVTVLSAFPQDQLAPVETLVLHAADWRASNLRRLRNHADDVISAPRGRFAEIMRSIEPDLVHTNNLPGIGSGIWEVARRHGLPVVHTLHDYHLLCPRTSLTRRDGSPCRPSPLLCGARTRRLARWAGGVRHLIAGSDHLHAAHRGLFSAEQHVIRLPLLRIGADAPPPPRDTPARLGYLGALTATKGVQLLLAAAPLLAERGIELSIAGDGPLRETVASSGVEYAGRLEGDAKVDFLMSCDVGVVPSLWDEPSGPPYVVCEWLGAGRPILATRRGGLREAERMGAVVQFDESAAGLAEAAAVLRDPGAWQRLRSALPMVDGDADLDRWLGEHQGVYESALAARAEAA